MIIIQQAIYGEFPGRTSGHGLLSASDEKNELYMRVSGHTDLADRPEGGVLFNPVVRGFFAEDHFLLIKTFPDKSPGLRSGRVFAHVLFVPKADLHGVRNISNLFKYHLFNIQKEAEMSPLEYHPQETVATSGAVNGREAAATNSLLQNEQLVWLGEEGYWDWIDRIWPQLPIAVIHTLKVGAAFGPTYAKNEYLNLVYIPKNAKTLWERHEFRVVDSGEIETLQSPAAHWLVGNVEEALPFQLLLDDFALKINSIDLLNRLESHGNVYHQLHKQPELKHMLVLSHFISRVNPNENLGTKGKNKLLTAIVKTLPDATVQQIKSLTDQSWKGFPGAVASVSDALRKWLTNNLLNGTQAKGNASILLKALESDSTSWWTKTVLDYINDRLKMRQSSDFSILWHWMTKEPALIVKHAAWLPDDAENELIQKIPRLESSSAKTVLQMAEQKGWLVLHAKVAAQLYSAEKAIEAQLRLDTNVDYVVALEALSESMSGSSFVSEAVSHTDTRLHRIAGKLIAEDNKLLNGIDVTNKGWQQCWKLAIEQGCEVWSGISNPQHTLFEILDYLLAGNSFSVTLLNAISIGKFTSLKDYPQRALIWPMLPEKVQSKFISSTLVDLIDDLGNNKLSYNDFEFELKEGLQSQRVQQEFVCSKTTPLVKKLQMFDLVPGWGENLAEQLLLHHYFSKSESEQLGQLISKNNWKSFVNHLYNNRLRRMDLVPALLQSSHLLGFLHRLGLSVNGMKPDAITNDEWWEGLYAKAVELYPLGPTQNGLWTNAGGKLEVLHFQSVSGKQSWSFAINHIRNGAKPSVKKLLKEMQQEFPGDDTLIQLIQSQ